MALPALLSGGSKMISSGSKLVKTANISEKFLNIKSKKTTGENFGDKKPAAIVTQKSSSIIPSIPSFPSQQVKGKTIGTQTFSKTTSGGGKGTLEEDVRYIKDKVIEIDKLLKGSFSQRKKEEERLAKQSSDVERKKKEEKIEKGAGAGIMKGMGERVKKPFSNIFEGIKNYITAVLLGFVINKLAPLLPKLLEILPILAAAMEGVLNFAGFLLDGFVTFIDWGYQAYDATRGFIEKIGGENAVKAFDKFSEIFNQAMNLALIVAMASAAGGGPGGKPGGKPGAGFRPKPGTGGRPKVTTTGGRGAGRPDLRNPLRQRPQITGASPSRMRGLPGIGQIAEGIGSGFKGIGGKISGVGKAITSKFIAPIINVALPKVPPKVRTRIASAVAKKGIARFLPFVNTLFGTVEGASRLMKGDTEGALLSFASAIPVAGWGALALDIYRSVDPEGYKKNIRMGMTTEDMNAALQMKKKEGGGVIETPSYVLGGLLGKASAGLGSIGMIKLPPIPKFNLPKLTPTSIGDAISGGIQKLFSFFGIGGEAKQTEPPSYIEALINLANKVKDVPLIGGSMFAAIQLALGMKVDRNVLSAVGGQLVNFSNLDAFKGITSSISKLSSALKFEKGGLVTSTVVSLAPSDNKKSVVSLSNYLDSEIKSIELELEEEKMEEEEGTPPGGPGGPGDPGEPGGASLPDPKSAEMYRIAAALSTEGSGANSVVDIMQVVVNRKASGRYGKTFTDILAAGRSVNSCQFQGVWKRPGGPNAFRKIQTLEDASKWSGQSQKALLGIIKNIQDRSLQANSANHVGGALEFRAAPGYYKRFGLVAGEMGPDGRFYNSSWRGGPGDNQYLKQAGKNPTIGAAASFNLPAPQPAPKDGGGFKSTPTAGTMGSGHGSGGVKIAGELGDFMKANKGKIGVTGSIHQHPRHPPLERRGYKSYHNEGRALDIGGYSPSSIKDSDARSRGHRGQDEQAPVIRALLKWNQQNNYKPVQLTHASPAFRNLGKYKEYPDIHHHHVHVAYQGGGMVDDKKSDGPDPILQKRPKEPEAPSINKPGSTGSSGSGLGNMPGITNIGKTAFGGMDPLTPMQQWAKNFLELAKKVKSGQSGYEEIQSYLKGSKLGSISKTAFGMPNLMDTTTPTDLKDGKITPNSGTKVKGAGVDTQLIATQPGEVVINKPTVNVLGSEFFLALNRKYGESNANKIKPVEVYKAQGGGPISGSYKGLQQTMSYDNMQTQTLIQPVIVERQVPVPMPMPMGGGTKVIVAGGVNSNNDLFAG